MGAAITGAVAARPDSGLMGAAITGAARPGAPDCVEIASRALRESVVPGTPASASTGP
jgi:hypothetical protein